MMHDEMVGNGTGWCYTVSYIQNGCGINLVWYGMV